MRLAARNIHDETGTVIGTLVGVIPVSNRFQLDRLDDGTPLEGSLGRKIENAYEISREYTNRIVVAEIRSVRVGQGNPKHTLLGVSELPETNG